ncbi:TetR/AcrR family transcriptional regulator [Orenia marismortui]|uniref:TetR family transcriptional regulator n=1 Tax=Orenia marismortui TaxID=46469 RepID=A0A4R8GSU1_9FIRM|nr:TetR/AcrR family transcriptional regulator [Orenia marismortui]TDX49051.1 TetR family transcriptional regulator [Orenia marismortui]
MDKKEIKKQEIIRNSFHLMHLHGYNGTSVKDITDAASIPKGSFYNYFANKEDYAKEAIYYFYHQEDYINIFDDKNLKPLNRIVAFYEKKAIEFETEGFKCGCFVGNLTQEMGDVSELIAKATEDFYLELTKKISSCLEEADQSGDFNPRLDIEVLANFIVNSWQGILVRMKSQKDRKVLDDFIKVLNQILLK